MAKFRIGKTKTGYKVDIISQLGYKLGTKYFKNKTDLEKYIKNY